MSTALSVCQIYRTLIVEDLMLVCLVESRAKMMPAGPVCMVRIMKTEILQHYHVNKHTCIPPRHVMVGRVIYLTLRHPYHCMPVQVLETDDPARKVDFSRFMLNADAKKPVFFILRIF